jgi:predicted extracellular nuclease
MVVALLPLSAVPAAAAESDLIITGVVDGPLSGGIPKAVEFYAINDIPDLSIYGFGSANNGGGTDGEEFTFPADSASAGQFIYVATESTAFTSFFGFAPDYTNGSAPSINGDDAIELFMNGTVADVFGDINVDGSGQAWDYLDGWAYRVDGTGPDGSTFVLANWMFSGINALDGETTNAGAATPFPIGTYAPSAGNAAVTVSCSDITTDFGTVATSGVTATDADGTVDDLSLSVDPTPVAGSISLESIVPAASEGGTATADVSVTADVPAGIYGVVVTGTNTDAEPQMGTCSLTVTVSPTTVTSIHDIQYTTDSSGDSPHEDQFVLTEGVVTAVFGSDAFIQDGTGPWSGLFVFNPTVTPSVGDTVRVVGYVSEYYGLTEITGSLEVVGTDTVPDPELLSTGDIGQEQWESVFVRAENATVANPDLGFGEWSIDDGSGAVVVDDLGSYDYVPATGDDVQFLQGPLNYSFGAFKIEPRDNYDMLVITPIGVVQGSVSDTDNGPTFDSSYVDDYVTIQAVVTQKVLSRTSSGSNSWGFFLQNTAATADGDPNSSDGIFLYTGYYDDIYNPAGGYYYLEPGDELVIRARVSEYYHLTELSSASLVSVVRTGVDLDSEVPAFTADPPGDIDDAGRYWERREGMRAQIPAGSTTLGGRDVFASTLDGEVWLAAPGSPIAALSGYEQRAFRDERNLSFGEAPGNGFRIVLGSLGIKGAMDDNTALIAPVRTFDTITNSPIGGVYFSFSKYQIQVGEQLEFTEGPNPSGNYPPVTPNIAEQYSLTTFNMENLYDYRDDPFDGCDFLGNSGCPGVYPPFDYAPANDTVYQDRLEEIASQVIYDLHAPDVVFAQELEDQDICTVDSSFELVCGTTNNADGKPDTLQELTTKIYAESGIMYDTAYDRDGADDRGIVNGYMFRTDRVELLAPSADDPVLGSSPTVEYRSDGLAYNMDVQNPKSLNADLPDDVDTSTGQDGDLVFTRAPLVGYFRIWQEVVGLGAYTDAYLIDNHFSSGPDARVGQRTEQANYNAAIVDALQAYDPSVRVVVGGDLNVYPDSSQLAGLYAQGMSNLYYSLLAAHPNAAYSYVYQGQAQTLDQLFVTPSMLSDLIEMRSAHINSDFPADYVGDGARGTSDHDPQVARIAYSENVTLETLEALVQYYADEGLITGNKTEKILLSRLAKARRFLDNGKIDAYMSQLQAFIDQIYDFTPQFIDPHAANVLTFDTYLLMMGY